MEYIYVENVLEKLLHKTWIILYNFSESISWGLKNFSHIKNSNTYESFAVKYLMGLLCEDHRCSPKIYLLPKKGNMINMCVDNIIDKENFKNMTVPSLYIYHCLVKQERNIFDRINDND